MLFRSMVKSLKEIEEIFLARQEQERQKAGKDQKQEESPKNEKSLREIVSQDKGKSPNKYQKYSVIISNIVYGLTILFLLIFVLIAPKLEYDPGIVGTVIRIVEDNTGIFMILFFLLMGLSLFLRFVGERQNR